MKRILILLSCLTGLLLLGGCDDGTRPTMPARIERPQPKTTEAEISTELEIVTEEYTEEEIITEEETTEAIPVIPDDPNNIIDLSTTLYTYSQMAEDLAYLESCYPHYMDIEVAGTTADNRDIYTVYLGNRDADRQIFICAATHGREYMTTQLVMKQLEYYCAHYEDGIYNNSIPYSDIFENTCFVVVPMVNPDGVSISQLGEEAIRRQDLKDQLRAIYDSDIVGQFTDLDYATYLSRWKANGAGVDLNRNYSPGWDTINERPVPSSSHFKGNEPGSEAEAQTLMNLVNSLSNPLLAISYHSYGNLVYWQYGQAEPLWTENSNLATHISNHTGYTLAGYSNEAGFSNWCVIEKGIPSVTVETGSVPTPLPLDQFDPIWNVNREMWVMLGSIY